MDLSMQYREALRASLRSGYDTTKPILVSKSKRPALDKLLLDGRQRIVELDQLRKEGVTVPPLDRIIKYIEIDNIDQIRAIRATLAQKSIAKSHQFAAAYIEQNLRAIIADNSGKRDIGAYIESLGFKDQILVARLADAYQRNPHKKLSPQRSKPRRIVGLPEDLSAGWGDPADTSGSQFDSLVDYKHVCGNCKSPLKIVTRTDGTVVRVEVAPRVHP